MSTSCAAAIRPYACTLDQVRHKIYHFIQLQLFYSSFVVIYDIKCILDEMLDIVENFTDKIIGDCKPILEGLVGEYNMAVCKSGLDAVGKCLGSNTLLHSTH